MPIAVCQNISVVLSDDGIAAISPDSLDGGSTFSGCSGALTIDVSNFDCTNVGTPVMVTLTAVNSNGSDSCTALVNVVDNVTPSITCPEEILIIAEVSPYVLPDYISEGIVTISDNCLDQLIVTQTPTVGTEVEEGETEITITVTDPSGNSGSCSFDIFVDPTLSSNASENLQALQLFPNPTENSFSISGVDQIGITSITIFDITGREVKGFTISEIQQNTFSVSEIASATYFVIITSETGSTRLQLIKQ